MTRQKTTTMRKMRRRLAPIERPYPCTSVTRRSTRCTRVLPVTTHATEKTLALVFLRSVHVYTYFGSQSRSQESEEEAALQ